LIPLQLSQTPTPKMASLANVAALHGAGRRVTRLKLTPELT